jgi:hypothetical protein
LRDLHLRRVFALFAALGGSSLTVPAYQKLEVGTYLEYGVYDWLTVVAAPAYDRVRTPPPGQSYTGLGESEFAARVGLYRTDTAVFSVQAGLRSPGASFDSLGPLEVRRAASLDLRGMAGCNYIVAGMEGFVDTQGDAAELHFDCQWRRPVRPCVLDQVTTTVLSSFIVNELIGILANLPRRFANFRSGFGYGFHCVRCHAFLVGGFRVASDLP